MNTTAAQSAAERATKETREGTTTQSVPPYCAKILGVPRMTTNSCVQILQIRLRRSIDPTKRRGMNTNKGLFLVLHGSILSIVCTGRHSEPGHGAIVSTQGSRCYHWSFWSLDHVPMKSVAVYPHAHRRWSTRALTPPSASRGPAAGAGGEAIPTNGTPALQIPPRAAATKLEARRRS